MHPHDVPCCTGEPPRSGGDWRLGSGCWIRSPPHRGHTLRSSPVMRLSCVRQSNYCVAMGNRSSKSMDCSTENDSNAASDIRGRGPD